MFKGLPALYLLKERGVFRPYTPNLAEKLGDQVMTTIRVCYKIGLYLSPMIAIYLYRHTWYALTQSSYKFVVFVPVVYGLAFLLRGVGRSQNKDFCTFAAILRKFGEDPSDDNRKLLRQFDFEFDQWPVDYSWSDEDINARHFIPGKKDENGPQSKAFSAVRNAVASLVAKTVGIRLMYPGSTSLLGSAMWPQLLQNRAKLINEHRAVRYKLKSSVGDSIDTIFVDRRNNPQYPMGKILILTCEGNAGFYETGLVNTALSAGYSVLGWNHPGFGGSSGDPWPSSECAAVDVVAQFACQRLGFDEGDVAVFAWSIGGFAASWLAMNRPTLRGVLLDAVFDHVLPLARHAMPLVLHDFVGDVIANHFNLNIGDQIKSYDGPVKFIRRTNEEIIVTDNSNPENQRKSNLINILLKSFLRHRFPYIFDAKNERDIDAYVKMRKAQRFYFAGNEHNDEDCVNLLSGYFKALKDVKFPSEFGSEFNEKTKNHLAYFLVDFYLTDFDATHCVPLTADFLTLPHHPWEKANASKSNE